MFKIRSEADEYFLRQLFRFKMLRYNTLYMGNLFNNTDVQKGQIWLMSGTNTETGKPIVDEPLSVLEVHSFAEMPSKRGVYCDMVDVKYMGQELCIPAIQIRLIGRLQVTE